MYYWQHPSMRDQKINQTSSIPSSWNLSTINTLISSNRHTTNKCLFLKMAKQMRPEQAEDTRLPPLYLGDVMSYPLHPHVKVLENRNKHEHHPGKVNDVQNPLVDSGRVVVAFPDQQKDFSPFLSQNEHSTVRLQARWCAKQRADSLSNREEFPVISSSTTTNSVGVANTQKEGSDSEEAGERAEKDGERAEE
ncbi:hypothetical protein BLNAU_19053 [Blattamonas nauphoetae]|uniref:Uncharacterized protein n=1 Tax=Blattamonas nauphoetae TaxID=2049346 RepID=A0ABQ9X2X5_9EUKA|nr:hypothetical protein BLNAU_19053 [Blattamonas nauphoetae]